MFVPLEGIKSFLRDCVLNVCPKELLGSKDNWDLVISGVDMFAGARTSEGFDAQKGFLIQLMRACFYET
ncbi:hypothetical protein TrRE_jg11240 [Triparma retinervis]|uniref:Uncharacterized protein n=1 Tax=Triparma retinervis TaxID=2557542 RepID=A0A9W7E1C6_9STRA|nr:hypothetical protein TrRE_jg11240 [Triparma retinervis]